MSTPAQHVEDLLLDFAYGELAADEARAVQAHVDGCEQCRASLEEMQGVRKVMSRLPEEAAPSAGLDSLLAYAEQAARRVQAGPPPKPTLWRRLFVPVSGLMAVAVIGVIAHEVSQGTPSAEETVNQALFEPAKAAAPAPIAAPTPTMAEEAEDDFAGNVAGGMVDSVDEARPPPPPSDPAPFAQVARPERKRELASPMKPAPKGAGPPQEAKAKEKTAARPIARGVGDLVDLDAKKRDAPTREAARPAAPAPAEAPYDEIEEEMAAAPASPRPDVNTRAEAQVAADSVGQAEGRSAAEDSGHRAQAHRLSSQAAAARARGDFAEEARLLRAAVAVAPRDRTVLGNLLLRLCDAEYQLGRDAAAEQACGRASAEFPGTSTAATAQRRMMEQRVRRSSKPATASEPASTGQAH